ncbi:MAG TPA: Fic family protein [bacterium]|nr:Fic family protein [bacterium]
MEFKPHLPFDGLPPLPPLSFNSLIKHPNVLSELVHAEKELSYLKGLCGFAPNPMVFLSLPMIRESVASLEIEALQTTVNDVIQGQMFPDEQKSPAAEKAIQYLDAIKWGFNNLRSYQLTHKLICGVQERVLGTKEGYRRTPNAIQTKNIPPKTIYTPPIASLIPQKMSNWERFANTSDPKIVGSSLIRAVLCHYQFEAIHPFGDGNGRTGRILLVLHLVQEGLLTHPILNVSEYLNKKRPIYYHSLLGVTKNRAWQRFTLFMLRAITRQAQSTSELILKLKKEHEYFNERLKSKFPKIFNSKLPDHIFENIYTSPSFVERAGIMSRVTASNHLNKLSKSELLMVIEKGTYRFFCIPKVYELLNTKKADE